MRLIRRLCGPFFVLAGTLHFLKPGFYLSIMPSWLPWHSELVAASGVAEIAGGLALLSPDARVRRAGGWFTIATLLGVYPANINMALHEIQLPGLPPAPVWALWARLPLQLVLIAWALWCTRAPSPASPRAP